jgi:WD40 repeat protein
MISYCPNTRRLAVGSKSGQFTMYELRSAKEQVHYEGKRWVCFGLGLVFLTSVFPSLQVIPAHSAAITAVQFSKDGKFLATYSYEEAKVNFWQVRTNTLYIPSRRTT